jgi:hypothetical protein
VIEAGVTTVIALVAALAAINTRTHNRINELDKRVDCVELSVAKNYVSRTEHFQAMERIEEHMVRIEGKLDLFIQNYPRR